MRDAILEALCVAGAVLAIGWVMHLDLESAEVTAAVVEEVNERRALPPAVLLHPLCPDQFVAQRGADERWQVRCVIASTEGSRAHE